LAGKAVDRAIDGVRTGEKEGRAIEPTWTTVSGIGSGATSSA
jgi:hypothetical protein